mmetsp:Transcript_15782/g.39828  ORF Transcript_15782/g.39828 Transcript_15782/m.39828 type:complete len:244 (-) Transcript_15782:395-1126(-)
MPRAACSFAKALQRRRTPASRLTLVAGGGHRDDNLEARDRALTHIRTSPRSCRRLCFNLASQGQDCAQVYPLNTHWLCLARGKPRRRWQAQAERPHMRVTGSEPFSGGITLLQWVAAEVDEERPNERKARRSPEDELARRVEAAGRPTGRSTVERHGRLGRAPNLERANGRAGHGNKIEKRGRCAPVSTQVSSQMPSVSTETISPIMLQSDLLPLRRRRWRCWACRRRGSLKESCESQTEKSE